MKKLLIALIPSIGSIIGSSLGIIIGYSISTAVIESSEPAEEPADTSSGWSMTAYPGEFIEALGDEYATIQVKRKSDGKVLREMRFFDLEEKNDANTK